MNIKPRRSKENISCIFCKYLEGEFCSLGIECNEGEYAKMRPAVLDINRKVTYGKALEYAKKAGSTWDLPMLWEMEKYMRKDGRVYWVHSNVSQGVKVYFNKKMTQSLAKEDDKCHLVMIQTSFYERIERWDRLYQYELIEWGRDIFRRLSKTGLGKSSLREYDTLKKMENKCPWCEVAKINSTFDDFCEACPIDWDDETRTCRYQWSDWIDAVESGNVEKARSLAKKLSCVRER
jgi:hypothetical protein